MFLLDNNVVHFIKNQARYSSRGTTTTDQSSATPPDNNDSGSSYDENVRNRILGAALPFVPHLGWSKEALTAGAESIGYPGIVHGMFTRSGADLIDYYLKDSNKKLVDFMKQELLREQAAPAVFVERAVQERLKMLIPYLDKWPQAIAILTLPPNVPTALATLLTMVDDICYHAGDRSVDFNWYARRIALAGVYKTSELYMIQDKSADFNDTWLFLNRRLSEAVQIHDLLLKTDSSASGGQDKITSAFITARNILGLNQSS